MSCLRTTKHLHHVAGFIADWGGNVGSAHLGALGINQNTYVWRHCTRVADYRLDAFGSGMGGVHAHHVHASQKQLAQKVLVAATVADAAYYLCLLHSSLNYVGFILFLLLPAAISHRR